ncbi:MAG TPA: hypothetical protein VKD21_14640 [Acidimicrobiales bacterium]|nr:hypothetical protein [Acidimicrobiales bacterium]
MCGIGCPPSDAALVAAADQLGAALARHNPDQADDVDRAVTQLLLRHLARVVTR